jgi:hypothetical protein
VSEVTFVIIGMLISCGLFAYTINVIGVVVEEISKDNRLFKREMSIVNRYM